MFHYYNILLQLMNLKKSLIVLCCFSEPRNIAAMLSSSNFPTKLIYWGILVFVSLDESVPISL